MVYSVENLSFAYGPEPVIAHAGFTMKPGVFYGLLGPNGCGKTTLIDLLVRHLNPGEGRIRFQGKNLECFSRKALSREVALVAQNPVIHFPYKVSELVMMGRHPYIGRFSSPSAEDYRVVDRVMEQADVLQFKHALITELSGGERQRALFARALAQETPVLILDEATSNLDIRHSLSLLSQVRDDVERRGKTVVAVFQDINMAALFCHHLLFMVKGHIHREGQVEDVLDRQVIRDVYGVDSKVCDELFSGTKQVLFQRTGLNHGEGL